MNELKAIPTVYKGIEFRSRLEARWAVFFDACGVDWEYEPEGFELSDGTWYLPDFLLHNVFMFDAGNPKNDLWVEVKGHLTPKDLHKAELFCGRGREIELNRRLTFEELVEVILSGCSLKSHPDKPYSVTLPPKRPIIILGQIPKGSNLWELYDDVERRVSRGEFSRKFISAQGIEDIAFPESIITEQGKPGLLINIISHWPDEQAIKRTYKAYKRALSAKFEHGQTPLTTPVWKEGK